MSYLSQGTLSAPHAASRVKKSGRRATLSSPSRAHGRRARPRGPQGPQGPSERAGSEPVSDRPGVVPRVRPPPPHRGSPAFLPLSISMRDYSPVVAGHPRATRRRDPPRALVTKRPDVRGAGRGETRKIASGFGGSTVLPHFDCRDPLSFWLPTPATDKRYASRRLETRTSPRRAARRPPRWRGSARSLAAPRRPGLGQRPCSKARVKVLSPAALPRRSDARRNVQFGGSVVEVREN